MFECFGKAWNKKPTCKFLECKGLHAKSLHNLLMVEVSTVSAMGCEDACEEGEEGFINIAQEERGHGSNKGLRSPDDLWLDMEEECEKTLYYVNVIIDSENNANAPKGDQEGERGKSSLENVCGSSAEDLEGGKGSDNGIQTKKRKDDFQDNENEMYPLPAKKRRPED
jgi:hypothetical protein